MKIGTRVSRSSDTPALRVERLKERLLRERARELQDEIRQAHRDGAAIEATRVLSRSWR